MLMLDLLNNPTRIPPITTEIIPEKRYAPDANAILHTTEVQLKIPPNQIQNQI
jgi:hypothetical protein